MRDSLLEPADRKTAAAMQSERVRMRAELTEVIVAAQRTVARRALCLLKSRLSWPEKNCRLWRHRFRSWTLLTEAARKPLIIRVIDFPLGCASHVVPYRDGTTT